MRARFPDDIAAIHFPLRDPMTEKEALGTESISALPGPLVLHINDNAGISLIDQPSITLLKSAR